MPVLSVHTTSVHPSVSTLAMRLMMALRRAMRDTPRARVTAVTAGRPSGMVATARATAVSSTSLTDSPRTRPMAATTVTMPPDSQARLRASPSSWRCRGVVPVPAVVSSPAM